LKKILKNKNKKYQISAYFGYSSKNNLTMLIMYYLSYPLVLFFENIKIKPNTVTFLSVIFSFLSLVYLIYFKNLELFVLTFFISQLLDYCDGTLARKTNQVSTAIINPDKISDLIKVFFIHISLAIYFKDLEIWVLSFISLFLFLFYVIIELLAEKKNIYNKKNQKNILLRNRFSVISKIYNLFLFGPIIKFIYRFCTTMQGQSVLIFIIAPFNDLICRYVLFYFIFVTSFNLVKTFKRVG